MYKIWFVESQGLFMAQIPDICHNWEEILEKIPHEINMTNEYLEIIRNGDKSIFERCPS